MLRQKLSLWQQFWTFLPWSLLPYMWQSETLRRENLWRELLNKADADRKEDAEWFRGDMRRMQKRHEEERKQDQRAMLLSDVLETLEVPLESDISEVGVFGDGRDGRSSICNVRFRQDGIRREFHIVCIDVSDFNEKGHEAE